MLEPMTPVIALIPAIIVALIAAFCVPFAMLAYALRTRLLGAAVMAAGWIPFQSYGSLPEPTGGQNLAMGFGFAAMFIVGPVMIIAAWIGRADNR